MYKYIIADNPKNSTIYVDLITSQAGHYLGRNPYVLNLLREVFANLRPKGTKVALEHDMGRIIGNTDIIETKPKDTIYYAKANKKDVFSRFARNRYPVPSSLLTTVLEQDTEGNYALTDVWIGPLYPPYPGEDDATADSKEFWETHALVQDAQAIQGKTITKAWPY